MERWFFFIDYQQQRQRSRRGESIVSPDNNGDWVVLRSLQTRLPRFVQLLSFGRLHLRWRLVRRNESWSAAITALQVKERVSRLMR